MKATAHRDWTFSLTEMTGEEMWTISESLQSVDRSTWTPEMNGSFHILTARIEEMYAKSYARIERESRR